MTTLIYCLLLAMLLPYLVKIPVALAMNKLGGYDNAYPRNQQEQLQGFGARALAAHKNAFESLILFSTATLTAIATGHVDTIIEMSAVIYIISRFIYNVCYLCNWPTLRSTFWLVGMICCFTMVWLSLPVPA